MIESFPSFFRSTQANKGYWDAGAHFGGKKRSGRTIPTTADETFKQVWAKLNPVINNGEPANIWQFLVITSIMINETGGTFVPVSEKGDLKYMYGINGGLKRSYNSYKANKSVYELLNTELFIETHKHTPFDEYVIQSGKSNDEWKSETYPNEAPIKPSEGGIMAEADFYKFRGRGLIQTTFRDNYIPLIEAIINYRGENSIINEQKNKWAIRYNNDVQKIATASTNSNWDDLFMKTEMEFAALGVKTFFDKRTGCIDLKNGDHLIKNKTAGSLYYVGLQVGGSDNYGQVLRARVLQIYEAMKEGGING